MFKITKISYDIELVIEILYIVELLNINYLLIFIKSSIIL